MAAQIEKPEHFKYLKSFRTEQCNNFVNKCCAQHRPYTCFDWHFPNQRRRRSILKRDSGFNYSPDIYCTNYDEVPGCCPEKDACPFLHHNFGESEKRYHLRFYKTDKCVHPTDARGFCTANGQHCPFAHSDDDLRKPVFGKYYAGGVAFDGSRTGNWVETACEEALEKVDQKWHDKDYLLAHYKTELCPTNGPQCRRAMACCPYYHDKDRRRNPKEIHYRGVACPYVKVNDKWGDAADCDHGDQCNYCHTRVELQYHPDVFKRVQCEIELRNQCYKGIFCPFIHRDIVDEPSFTNGHAAIGYGSNGTNRSNGNSTSGLETFESTELEGNGSESTNLDEFSDSWMNLKGLQINRDSMHQPSYASNKPPNPIMRPTSNRQLLYPHPSTSDSFAFSSGALPNRNPMIQTPTYDSGYSDHPSRSASIADSNQTPEIGDLDRFDDIDDQYLDDLENFNNPSNQLNFVGIGLTNVSAAGSIVTNTVDRNQYPFGTYTNSVISPTEVEMLKRELELTKQLRQEAIKDKDKAINERDMANQAMAKLKEDNEGQQTRGGGGGGVVNQVSDLEKLSFPVLQRKETQLRLDLMKLQEVMYRKANGQCIYCFENPASGALTPPCSHRSVCINCISMADECPICHLPFHPVK